jgi:hypothetical protein
MLSTPILIKIKINKKSLLINWLEDSTEHKNTLPQNKPVDNHVENILIIWVKQVIKNTSIKNTENTLKIPIRH